MSDFIRPPAKILVTGANGFLGIWICRQLLEAGYAVRGTVRHGSKGDYLVDLFRGLGIDARFEYLIVPDVVAASACDDAVKGVHAVIHTASPVRRDGNPQETLTPAVQGTTFVLSSIYNFGSSVRRVVITSCAVAVLEPHTEPYVYTEHDWNDSVVRTYQRAGDQTDPITVYRASKVLAERAAWIFMGNHQDTHFDLVTLLPTYVLGPLLQDTSTMTTPDGSMQVLTSGLVREKNAEECGAYYSDWVDVRDVGHAHVRALQVREAGGERCLISGGSFAWQDIYDALALANPPIPNVPRGTPGATRTTGTPVSNEKSRQILDLDYRALNDTVVDSVRSLEDRLPI